jgi:hypothetical protein
MLEKPIFHLTYPVFKPGVRSQGCTISPKPRTIPLAWFSWWIKRWNNGLDNPQQLQDEQDDGDHNQNVNPITRFGET